MATFTTPDGSLTVTYPTGYQVEFGDDPTHRTATRRRADVPTDSVTSLDGESAAGQHIVAALAEQGLQLVAPVDLAPGPGSDLTRAQPAQAELEVTVGPDEDAVLLLEQDGVYRWLQPTDRPESARPTQRRRGGTPTDPAGRRVAFTFGLGQHPAPGPERRSGTAGGQRGFLSDLVFTRARAYVLKFLARKVTDLAVEHLESHVVPGLVRLAGPDPAGWHHVGDLSAVELPDDRPARLLLLIHGTFSSTVGAFGALGAFSWGQDFLGDALRRYDAVLGFDHRTLSEDPRANAERVLHAVKAAGVVCPPVIDIVCHSRGALVARSLAELVLPRDPAAGRVRRIVLVAGTNNGTELARPKNWSTMIDLYTNLVAAAARTIALVPQAKATADVVRGLVAGLGAFVKYAVSYAVKGEDAVAGVPGLAAMLPEGPFVSELNKSQPGQPTPASAPWYVVTSDFDPDQVEPDAASTSLPRRLLAALADGVVDQLMGEGNDLVVDTASMSAVELSVGGFVKDRLDFGVNAEVHHCAYFARPEVCAALTRWLGLDAPVPAPVVAPIGVSVRPALPLAASENIVVVDAADSVREVRTRLAAGQPEYVVLRRDRDTVFAFTDEEMVDRLARTDLLAQEQPVAQVFALPDAERSQRCGIVTWRHLPSTGVDGPPSSRRTVLFDQDHPVAVVATAAPPAPLETLTKDVAGGSFAPVGATRAAPGGDVPQRFCSLARDVRDVFSDYPTSVRFDESVTRGSVPDDAPKSGARSAEKTDVAATVSANFQASMPDAVEVGRTETVACTVSRELLPAGLGISADGTAAVFPEDPILVQVIARTNGEVVGEDRVQIQVPEEHKPAELFFDVRATHVGPGEIWVVARQGPVPLVTLRLTPTFVEAPVAGAAGTTSTEATVPTQTPPTGVRQSLRITERTLGTDTVYDFELEASDLQVLCRYSSEPLKNRDEFIGTLYTNIEDAWASSGMDAKAFGRRLQAIGATLFDELIPRRLREQLWELRTKLRNIMVISTEPLIPWELVHLKASGSALPHGEETWFLAQFGLVRWLHGTWPPDQLHRREGRVYTLAPDYPQRDHQLPGAQAEAKLLGQLLGAAPLPPDSASVLGLLGGPGAFDVLHFAGHGRADSKAIGKACILLAGQMRDGRYQPDLLDPVTVGQTACLVAEDGERPLVFLNACQSGRLGHQLSALGGFAEAFVNGSGADPRPGAGAFIGTLWSVGDSPASQFTETFYRALLGGSTLAEAAVAGREAARSAGDATWLAYAVYGNPGATLH